MSSVHQSFVTELNTKPYEQGLSRMEAATKTSTARVTRELSKVNSSGFARIGQASLQVQDIAVQMQAGASASRIIAQQGSQIASLFGPGGMILGGLVAIGAMMWETAHASEKIKKEAAETAKIQRIQAQTQENKKTIDQVKADQLATRIAEARKGLAKEEADQVERRLRLEERIAAIRDNPHLSQGFKDTAEEAARDRFRAEEAERFAQQKLERGNERVRDIGQEALDRAAQIRGEGMSRSEARQRQREIASSERRAINEQMDRIDRERRNDLPSKRSQIEKPGPTGLSDEERKKAREAREGALDAAKKGKQSVMLDQESVDKIINGIDNLITR